MIMNFLELTSLIDEPQGYADEPDFITDVWPLLRRKGAEIKNVFLLRDKPTDYLGWPGQYSIVSNNIRCIGSFEALTEAALGQIRHWSYYGGHLNVIYQVSTESSLSRELCNLYPVVKLSSDDIDPLGLRAEVLAELRVFISESPKEFLHFSFCHDADPIYMIGELETLRALLREYFEARRV